MVMMLTDIGIQCGLGWESLTMAVNYEVKGNTEGKPENQTKTKPPPPTTTKRSQTNASNTFSYKMWPFDSRMKQEIMTGQNTR